MPNYTLPNPADFDGNLSGKKTRLVVLKNSACATLALSNFGARIVSLLVPDNRGIPTDIVLGFPSIQAYLNAGEPYHGATIGRFANRIADGKFTILGDQYATAPNNGPNALHGGKNGFHQQVWDYRINQPQEVDFYYTSADGEAGFPGNLSVVVTYQITDDNELIIRYRAETDKPTVVNLTNHAFFNLNGEGNGDVLSHRLQLNADTYLPISHVQIPTGEIAEVEGTPFDFRNPKTLGHDIGRPDEQLANGRGYDHCYVLNPPAAGVPAATIVSPQTGIQLNVATTEPAIQLYSGNMLTGQDIGKQGNLYNKHSAFCLETQHFPDSPNHAHFPSTLLTPGHVFQSETIYQFSVAK